MYRERAKEKSWRHLHARSEVYLLSSCKHLGLPSDGNCRSCDPFEWSCVVDERVLTTELQMDGVNPKRIINVTKGVLRLK